MSGTDKIDHESCVLSAEFAFRLSTDSASMRSCTLSISIPARASSSMTSPMLTPDFSDTAAKPCCDVSSPNKYKNTALNPSTLLTNRQGRLRKSSACRQNPTKARPRGLNAYKLQPRNPPSCNRIIVRSQPGNAALIACSLTTPTAASHGVAAARCKKSRTMAGVSKA